MRTIDFSPLYAPLSVFDRLADLLDAASTETASGYPPYNIERTGENSYRIEIAVAGFKSKDLNIEIKENPAHRPGPQERNRRHSALPPSRSGRAQFRTPLPAG